MLPDDLSSRGYAMIKTVSIIPLGTIYWGAMHIAVCPTEQLLLIPDKTGHSLSIAMTTKYLLMSILNYTVMLLPLVRPSDTNTTVRRIRLWYNPKVETLVSGIANILYKWNIWQHYFNFLIIWDYLTESFKPHEYYVNFIIEKLELHMYYSGF